MKPGARSIRPLLLGTIAAALIAVASQQFASAALPFGQTARLTVPESVAAGRLVTALVSVRDRDGREVPGYRLVVNWGDGTGARTSVGGWATHVYREAGTRRVTLVVFKGTQTRILTTVVRQIEVGPVPPAPDVLPLIGAAEQQIAGLGLDAADMTAVSAVVDAAEADVEDAQGVSVAGQGSASAAEQYLAAVRCLLGVGELLEAAEAEGDVTEEQVDAVILNQLLPAATAAFEAAQSAEFGGASTAGGPHPQDIGRDLCHLSCILARDLMLWTAQKLSTSDGRIACGAAGAILNIGPALFQGCSQRNQDFYSVSRDIEPAIANWLESCVNDCRR